MRFPIYYVTTFESPGLFRSPRYAFSILDILTMKKGTAIPFKFAMSLKREDDPEYLDYLVFSSNTAKAAKAVRKYFADSMTEGRKVLDTKRIISFPIKYTLSSVLSGAYYHRNPITHNGHEVTKDEAELRGRILLQKGCPVIPISSIRDSRAHQSISYIAIYPDIDNNKDE